MISGIDFSVFPIYYKFPDLNFAPYVPCIFPYKTSIVANTEPGLPVDIHLFRFWNQDVKLTLVGPLVFRVVF